MKPLLRLMHDHAGRSGLMNSSIWMLQNKYLKGDIDLEKVNEELEHIESTRKEMNAIIDNFYRYCKDNKIEIP